MEILGNLIVEYFTEMRWKKHRIAEIKGSALSKISVYNGIFPA